MTVRGASFQAGQISVTVGNGFSVFGVVVGSTEETAGTWTSSDLAIMSDLDSSSGLRH